MSINDGSCFCNGTTVKLPDDFARKIFSECLYTQKDALSFFIGLSSLFFWIFAQAPQFYLNCKLGRAKGLSLCFLLEWLTGDSLNLAGAFLTGQVGTAIATSLLFVSMDITLATQYMCLERPCCRTYDEDEDGDEDTDEETHREELDNPLLNTPNNNYGGVGQERPERKRALYSVFLPIVMLGALTVGSCGIVQLGSEVSLSQLAAQRGSIMRSKRIGSTVGRSLLDAVDHRGEVDGGEVDGADGADGADGGSGGGNNDDDEGSPVHEVDPFQHEPLPAVDCDATPPPSFVGKVLSWMSAAIYLLSRIPQIIKNYRRRSVQGLSPILFACAVLGNTTYALGIIIKGQRLMGALPFLIGSIGTLCFDATILFQFFIYRGLKPKKRRASTKQNPHLLEGVHGVSHWANSPFASPGDARDQRLKDEMMAADGQQNHRGRTPGIVGGSGGGVRRKSGLNSSYGGAQEWGKSSGFSS